MVKTLATKKELTKLGFPMTETKELIYYNRPTAVNTSVNTGCVNISSVNTIISGTFSHQEVRLGL